MRQISTYRHATTSRTIVSTIYRLAERCHERRQGRGAGAECAVLEPVELGTPNATIARLVWVLFVANGYVTDNGPVHASVLHDVPVMPRLVINYVLPYPNILVMYRGGAENSENTVGSCELLTDTRVLRPPRFPRLRDN